MESGPETERSDSNNLKQSREFLEGSKVGCGMGQEN